MKKQTETPLYATLFYHIRRELGLTWNEYIYLDMVYHLSKDGWCYKSLDNVANDLGMVKSGVVKLRDRLIDKGLIKKNIKGHVKTTVMYHSVVRLNENPYHSVTKRTTQEYGTVPLSGTKNNNKNNKEYKGIENRGKGFATAKSIVEQIKLKNAQ